MNRKKKTAVKVFKSEFQGVELTSMLLSVLNSIRSWSLLKAWLEYLKLKVEKGEAGSSNMSKSPNSISLSESLGTPSWKQKREQLNLTFSTKNVHMIY